MNKAILVGRLTKNPELKHSQGANAIAVAYFTLAVPRKYKNEDQDSDFITCRAFGKMAEFVDKYFRQGMKMILSGRIQTGSYTNKDGQKVYTTVIVAEEIEFAEKKATNSSSGIQEGFTGTEMGDGFMNIPDGIDEELPFN